MAVAAVACDDEPRAREREPNEERKQLDEGLANVERGSRLPAKRLRGGFRSVRSLFARRCDDDLPFASPLYRKPLFTLKEVTPGKV